MKFKIPKIQYLPSLSHVKKFLFSSNVLPVHISEFITGGIISLILSAENLRVIFTSIH